MIMMTIDQARAKVAEDMRKSAHAIIAENKFASHVTDEDKQEYLQRKLEWADEVADGLHDNNFTVWQRMRGYTHGDCPALLP